ncbi:MAG TPA: potassium channel family protein [Jatrophihabitans sp.]
MLVRLGLRAVSVTAVVFLLYFTLPFSNRGAVETGFALAVALVAFAGLMVWHAHAIAQAPYPLVRAVVALFTSFPIFIVLFSSVYFMIDEYSKGSFSQAMTRLDALYFTVTTFATVGFGDITAVSEPARIITVVQIVLDLVLLGLVVRVFAHSAQAGLARRDKGSDDG